jgi:LL-diaminopimelate aminotransferase
MNQLPKRAYRLEHLPPYGFAILGQRIIEMTAAGRDIIRLDIGSPDLPPPPEAIAALVESAQNVKHYQYSSYRGDPAFRKAVAAYYARRFGVELHPDKEVLPLIGSKEGIVNFSLAYLDRGDIALVPNIAYPAYEMGARLAGAEVCYMPLDSENGFLPALEKIACDLSRAKVMWLNYPNNPTGAVADVAFYERALAFCRRHNILLCSDNPYAEVVYDGYTAPSALQAHGAKNHAVEFMSLSKMFNVAGWRLGAMVGSSEALENLLTVKSNIDSGHWKAVYDGGTAALNKVPQTWLDERNAKWGARREKILAALPTIGLEAFKSPASLYVWAKLRDDCAYPDEVTYCDNALEETGVSVTPGTMYGPGGQRHVRFSLGVADDRLDEALNRLREWYVVKV